MINRVVLVGRLTRDPEIRSTEKNVVASLRLAIDRAGGGDKSGYFDVDVWGKSADACAKWLRKGSLVGVDGSLRHREWEKDGQKRTAVSVVAWDVRFLSSKSDDAAINDDSLPF